MSALMSDCGTYRYRLGREWNSFGAGTVLWVMLNPSTADHTTNDHTIRRCISYSMDWSFAGLMVGNLYALRSKDPKLLKTHPAPVGPDNDAHLLAMSQPSYVGLVIAAWGTKANPRRVEQVCELLLSRGPIHCLGLTKDGHPKHPLYQPDGLKPVLYRDKNPAVRQS